MPMIDPRREQRLRDELRELPELVATAATAIRGERLGGEVRGRRVPGSRPPLNVAAAAVSGLTDLPVDVLDPLTWPIRGGGLVWVDHREKVLADDELPGSALSVLASWVRLAEADLLDAHGPGWTYSEPTRPDATPTVAGECAWLLRHIVWIIDQEWVTELASDVHKLTEDCRGVLRIRPEYRPRCQRCPGGQLVDEGSGYWRCPECGHTSRDRRMDLRRTVVHQEPMTVAQLVKAFAFRVKTVESWVARGHLVPVDPDAEPRRYHVLDALRLADRNGAETG